MSTKIFVKLIMTLSVIFALANLPQSLFKRVADEMFVGETYNDHEHRDNSHDSKTIDEKLISEESVAPEEHEHNHMVRKSEKNSKKADELKGPLLQKTTFVIYVDPGEEVSKTFYKTISSYKYANAKLRKPPLPEFFTEDTNITISRNFPIRGTEIDNPGHHFDYHIFDYYHETDPTNEHNFNFNEIKFEGIVPLTAYPGDEIVFDIVFFTETPIGETSFYTAFTPPTLLQAGQQAYGETIEIKLVVNRHQSLDWNELSESDSRAGLLHDQAVDNIYPGDFDGDGHDEVLLVNGSVMTLYKYFSTGWVQKWTNNANANAGDGIYNYRSVLRVGDFDGDGRDELLAHDLNPVLGTNVKMFAYRAGDFEIEWSNNGILSNGLDHLLQRNFIIGDFDGDHKDEILAFKETENTFPFTQTQTTTRLILIKFDESIPNTWQIDWDSDNEFNYPNLNHDSFIDYFNNAVAGDFDGDGKDDFFGLSGDGYMGVFKYIAGSWSLQWTDDYLPEWGNTYRTTFHLPFGTTRTINIPSIVVPLDVRIGDADVKRQELFFMSSGFSTLTDMMVSPSFSLYSYFSYGTLDYWPTNRNAHVELDVPAVQNNSYKMVLEEFHDVWKVKYRSNATEIIFVRVGHTGRLKMFEYTTSPYDVYNPLNPVHVDTRK